MKEVHHYCEKIPHVKKPLLLVRGKMEQLYSEKGWGLCPVKKVGVVWRMTPALGAQIPKDLQEKGGDNKNNRYKIGS